MVITLPAQVEIVEVGPRDGFQNLKEWIPTETKIKTIERLISAGIKKVECTSFVHPAAIPQMRDAEEIAEYVCHKYVNTEIKPIALVPNLVGAEKAYESGIREVSYVISASEKHNVANINRTRAQSLTELKRIKECLPDIKIRLDVATSFYCPFTGRTDETMVYTLIEEVLTISAATIVIADTIGMADPGHVYALSCGVKERFPSVPVALHLHDTKGMGLAGIWAGLLAGVTSFETAAGGLGGCPFAPGAAGNTATEDCVNMLHTMGIETGIDLAKYQEAVALMGDELKVELTSRLSRGVCAGH